MSFDISELKELNPPSLSTSEDEINLSDIRNMIPPVLEASEKDYNTTSVDKFLKENGLDFEDQSVLSLSSLEHKEDTPDIKVVGIESHDVEEKPLAIDSQVPIEEVWSPINSTKAAVGDDTIPPPNSEPKEQWSPMDLKLEEDSVENTTEDPWKSDEMKVSNENSISLGSISEVATKSDLSWDYMSKLLQENGFPAIELLPLTEVDKDSVVPEKSLLINTIHDLLQQFVRRGQVIQDLVLDSNAAARRSTRTEQSIETAAKEKLDMEKMLVKQKHEIQDLKEEIGSNKKRYLKQLKQLQREKQQCQQQLQQSEHRVKAKEAIVEQMQARMKQSVDKEKKNTARNKELFTKIHSRKPNGSKAEDWKSIEFIGMYENQREEMQCEIQSLKKEIRKLHEELKYSDIQKSGSANVTDELFQRMEKSRQEHEKASEKLKQREHLISKQLGAIEQDLVDANRQIRELEETNSNLQLELQSRPSVSAYRTCKKKLTQCELKLSQHQQALAEMNDIHELRKVMDTKTMIQSDRLNYKLQLNRLDALPKEILLQVVQQICRELNLNDISLILPSLQKLCAVMVAVPRMEKFIHDITSLVQNKNGTIPLEEVLPILTHWKNEITQLDELIDLKRQIRAELQQRPFSENQSLQSTKQILHAISELVHTERQCLSQNEVYEKATEVMQVIGIGNPMEPCHFRSTNS